MKMLLSIDQGTTSSRAVVYDEKCRPIASIQKEFSQFFPKSAWVEHDANEIWNSVLATVAGVIRKSEATEIAAIGITNQRETIVLWDRKTGEPVAPAIVWQDRRTSKYIEDLREEGREEFIQLKTGLYLDPYFSASKLNWLLNTVPDARSRAAAGELAAGTIDSWLIYKLTQGRRHQTDISNASRTMLMNINSGEWDPELLKLFDIPDNLLPKIEPTVGDFGETELFGKAIPIRGVAGDQQAALFGQHCHEPGRVKCTYGTGCFMLTFTGETLTFSKNRLLTTVAWKLPDSPIQYAIEGSVFVGGSAIQWLRDGLKIIHTASEINELAAQVNDSGGVILVPAFAGLGAPYWDSTARGAILGLTRGTTAAHIARATLDGIAFQVAELMAAMQKDSGQKITKLRTDGGASASDLLMQIQADTLGIPVERPANVESTALGAAMLAGLGAGIWKNQADLKEIAAEHQSFEPTSDPKTRKANLQRWRNAVKKSKHWEI